jgi:hypothetical protein
MAALLTNMGGYTPVQIRHGVRVYYDVRSLADGPPGNDNGGVSCRPTLRLTLPA